MDGEQRLHSCDLISQSIYSRGVKGRRIKVHSRPSPARPLVLEKVHMLMENHSSRGRTRRDVFQDGAVPRTTRESPAS